MLATRFSGVVVFTVVAQASWEVVDRVNDKMIIDKKSLVLMAII